MSVSGSWTINIQEGKNWNTWIEITGSLTINCNHDSNNSKIEITGSGSCKTPKNSKIKADIPWSGTITWNSWSIYYSKDITWSWTII